MRYDTLPHIHAIHTAVNAGLEGFVRLLIGGVPHGTCRECLGVPCGKSHGMPYGRPQPRRVPREVFLLPRDVMEGSHGTSNKMHWDAMRSHMGSHGPSRSISKAFPFAPHGLPA